MFRTRGKQVSERGWEMNPAEALYRTLREVGINFLVSVPCKLLAELINLLEQDRKIIYTPVAREEEGVGILAGASLAGKRPAIVMQNSGVGNSINAICSLLNYYRLPIVFIVSHRGSAGEKIEAQKPMGLATKDLFRAAKVSVHVVNTIDELAMMNGGISRSFARQESVAFLFPFCYWEDSVQNRK